MRWHEGRIWLSLLCGNGIWGVAGNLHFAAVGNWGFPDGYAKRSADQLRAMATTEQISFIVSPGSNFSGGVSGTEDEAWHKLWENVFGHESGALKMPFFTVLGSEDWAQDGQAQISRMQHDYQAETNANESIQQSGSSDTNQSRNIGLITPVWTFPNWWYHYVRHFTTSGGSLLTTTVKEMSVGFFFLDTFVISPTFPFHSLTSKHKEHLATFLTHGTKIFDYIIVVGDKPLRRTQGQGDNALRDVERMLQDAQIDMYIGGRDHVMESIEHENILHIQCGSFSLGSTLSTVLGNTADDSQSTTFLTGLTGFCGIELTADNMIVRFYNGSDGKVMREIVRHRKTRSRDRLSPYSHFGKLPPVVFHPLPATYLPSGEGVDFVRIVGTIGLIIGGMFAVIGSITCISRYVS